MRLAAAPISWGVCEVPGWGFQLERDRVLDDAARLGLREIEAGPPGFLPSDAKEARDRLPTRGIRVIGGFVTAVLHSSERLEADLAALDYLNGEAKLLRTRLAGPERLKLDGQIDGLNLLYQKINAGPLAPTAGCVKPGAQPATKYDEMLINYVLTFTAQLLACNLTRVACVGIDPVNSGSMPWLGGALASLAVHNDIAHSFRPDDPTTVRNLSKVQRWYAKQVAAFVTMLKAIPEGNGTAYDNTIILWSNELGDPARHMNNNIPFVLLGGGGAWKKGRYLKYSTQSEYKESTDAHTRLLTSIANQYGAGLTVFGDTRYPGELPRLVQ